jgi:hypothetical protein
MALWNHVAAKYAGGPPEITTSSPHEKGSIKDMMQAYIGEAKYDFNVDGYNLKNRTSWTLPEALRGESPLMATRMEVWTLNADNFYTRELLPIMRNDRLKIQMTKWCTI